MKITITGAGGYIGKHLTDQLRNEGHKITAIGLNLDNIKDQTVVKKEIDIFDQRYKFKSEYNSPDVLIHLAWQDGFIHNSPTHITSLPKHFVFLKNLIDQGLKHIVVMGSMHEIGFFEGKIDENTPTNPKSFYGIAKNSLRQILESYILDKDVTLQWIRGFYIYGDDYSNHSIFTKILEAENRKEQLFPFNSGKNQYDFIDIKDLVKQIAKVSTQTKISGIINCCSGKPVPLKNKVEEFLIKNKLKIKLDYGKFPDRPYDSKIIYGDTNKINQIMRTSK